MQKTNIGWCDYTVNLLRYRDPDGNVVHACVRISEGCRFCYAATLAGRWGRKGKDFTAENMKPLAPFFDVEGARKLLRSKKVTGKKVFASDMTDLFGEWVPDEIIDQHFAIFALRPDVTFQVLTKRAKRMREYLCAPATPGRIAKAADCIAVAQEIAEMGPEEIRPILAYPGYYVSDRGRVLSSSGSAECLFCGKPVQGIATKAYCDKKCKANAFYYRKTGRAREGARLPVEMSAEVGEHGHLRLMLYKDGKTYRELVHRLVLTAFIRAPEYGEEACHRNGDPSVNALPNLRWDNREGNLADRVRHGNGRSWSKLSDEQVRKIRSSSESALQLAARFSVSDTTIRNVLNGKIFMGNRMAWPIRGVHLGVSVEDQKNADQRIPHLLQTPAAIRWISAEPLLGPIDLGDIRETLPDGQVRSKRALISHDSLFGVDDFSVNRVDGIVVGGESGGGHREMPLDSAVNLARNANAAGASVFFKQDSGPQPGMQGRVPPDVWRLKDWPKRP